MAARVVPLLPKPRGRNERAFLPAALEIVKTPASRTLRVTSALIVLFLTAEPQSEQQRRQGSQSASDEPANVERASRLVYTARIALEEKGLVVDGKPVELAPGMAVVAEIKTGKRRVLDYLLSPLHRYSHDVLRER